jgi:hypothetical protein
LERRVWKLSLEAGGKANKGLLEISPRRLPGNLEGDFVVHGWKPEERASTVTARELSRRKFGWIAAISRYPSDIRYLSYHYLISAI